QRFEVATDRVTVVATGTVFAVTVDATATRVHVYEGRVEVHADIRIYAVATGETWSTHGATRLASTNGDRSERDVRGTVKADRDASRARDADGLGHDASGAD